MKKSKRPETWEARMAHQAAQRDKKVREEYTETYDPYEDLPIATTVDTTHGRPTA